VVALATLWEHDEAQKRADAKIADACKRAADRTKNWPKRTLWESFPTLEGFLPCRDPATTTSGLV
jgi:hypothetical protein